MEGKKESWLVFLCSSSVRKRENGSSWTNSLWHDGCIGSQTVVGTVKNRQQLFISCTIAKGNNWNCNPRKSPFIKPLTPPVLFRKGESARGHHIVCCIFYRHPQAFIELQVRISWYIKTGTIGIKRYVIQHAIAFRSERNMKEVKGLDYLQAYITIITPKKQKPNTHTRTVIISALHCAKIFCEKWNCEYCWESGCETP